MWCGFSNGPPAGEFREVWYAALLEGLGSKSTIASIAYTDRDGDGNREIIRSGTVVDCGEDCLCREGPVLEEFATVYAWDGTEGLFVQAE
jgi:hypothetical protein